MRPSRGGRRQASWRFVAIRSAMLVLPTLGLTVPAEARSPWTQPKKGGFFQLSAYSIGSYDALYQSTGPDFRLNREITDVTVEAYGEFGVSDRWTVLAVVPFKRVEAGDLVANPTLTPTTGNAGTLDRLGNVVIGARGKLIDRSFVLSAQFDIELPTRSFDPSTGLSTGYDSVTVAPSASIGKGWNTAYVSGYAGLGLRSNGFSSDWRVGFEGGYRFFGRLWLVGMLDLRRSFRNGDVVLPRANLETGLYVNDQEFLAYGAKLLIDIAKGFGLQGTVYTAAGGNNVARRGLMGLGFYYRWRPR